MTIIVQTGAGTVVGANSYADAAAVKAYWLTRGVDLSLTYSNTQIEIAAIEATGYLDVRYPYIGRKIYKHQSTQWPRWQVPLFLQSIIPDVLIAATAIVAKKALEAVALFVDPTYEASGQVVLEDTTKVGPIETTIKYSDRASPKLAESTPQFPEVTLLLKSDGLLASTSTGQVARG
jgi:hypothetical protein